MPVKIIMPALSPTMTDGTIAKWLKKEGDTIKSGEVIAEIETDKATMEYEASDDGVLGKILMGDGSENVAVNSLIGVLLEKGETVADVDAFVSNYNNSNSAVRPVVESTQSSSAPVVATKVESSKPEVSVNKGNKIFVTPLAKRIAEQNNIDLSSVNGSGPNGRIIKVDIEQAMQSGTASSGVKSNANANIGGGYEDKPVSGMRKTIAKRLLESKQNVPHYYLTVDCEMDSLLAARAKLNKMGEDKFKLSVNDFIIKATAMAMKDNPDMNASWLGDKIRYYTSSDVSVAVATPSGLITPIVRCAESKGLVEISNEMKSLVAKAKENKLSPSEYQGGGFSISNLGMFGIKDFCAIINPPQAGILAVGATEKKPVVKKDAIVIAQIMSITVSADHRVVDGAVAAKFLNSLKNYIENPVSMIL